MNDEFRLEQVKKTHNFKSLSFYVKKREKQSLYRKHLIKQLVDSGYYNELYYRFTNSNEDLDKLTDNDVKILEMFNYITPTEFNELYKELYFTQ